MFATGRIAAIHREHTKDEIRKSITELTQERAKDHIYTSTTYMCLELLQYRNER
jgi:hypothetical protein